MLAPHSGALRHVRDRGLPLRHPSRKVRHHPGGADAQDRRRRGDPRHLRRLRRDGFAFASWASRIPQVKDRLDLDPSELGLVLLAIAAGSVISLPLSGPVIARFGSRRTVTAMA